MHIMRRQRQHNAYARLVLLAGMQRHLQEQPNGASRHSGEAVDCSCQQGSHALLWLESGQGGC